MGYSEVMFCFSWFSIVAGFVLLEFLLEYISTKAESILKTAIASAGTVFCFVFGVVIFVKAMTHEYKLGIEKGVEICSEYKM